MKKSTKYIALLLMFVSIIVIATQLYNKLLEEYKPEDNISSKESTADNINTTADFTVYDRDGNQVKLSDNFGKPIVVNFWASWCGPCKSEMPSFEKLYKEFGEEVLFMMVNLTGNDSIQSAEDFISQNGYTYPLYFDQDNSAAIAYQITGVPMTAFIDQNGVLANSHMGAMDEDTLREYIDKLLVD